MWAVALAIPPIVAGVADVPRHAPSARHARRRVSSGSPRSPLPCSLARDHRRRRTQAGGCERMSTVAVVAHAGKTLGGGLLELRRELERQGVADPLWYEVPKSRKAPKQRPSRRSTRAPSSSSSGAATGWCSGASTLVDGADGHARDRPGRHREPVRDRTSSIPKDIEQAVRDRPATGHGASSTSGGSTASASPSWPAPDSTRR